MLSFKSFMQEQKIQLSKDPENFGATVPKKTGSTWRTANIPTHKLSGFEPDSKMNSPESKKKLKGIKGAIRRGEDLPPILVRKHPSGRGYQVIDGHHRFHAHKQLGIKTVPASIVPDKDIEETDN